MSDKYNGWTNYATWRVNLEWFDGMTAEDVGARRGMTPRTVALFLAESVEDQLQSMASGLALDYAMDFVSDVNWDEIAQHLIDDAEWPTVDEDEDEDEGGAE